MRRLKCHDPWVIQKYLMQYLTALESHDLIHRAQTLQAQSGSLTTSECQQAWEALDNIRIPAMLDAERRCCKLKVGQVAWSPTLQRAIDTVTYWQLQGKRLEGKEVASKCLARLRHAAQLTVTRFSPEEAKDRLREAIQAYKLVKSSSDQLQAIWIESLAVAKAASKGDRAATVLATMMRNESRRRESRLCRIVTGRGLSERVSTVLTKSGVNEWT